MEIMNPRHEIILSEKQIKERIFELGSQITRDYRKKDLVLIGVLKGSLLFFADLIRQIRLQILTDFVSLSSYEGNEKSSGVVKVINDITLPVENKDVIIVEDIIDTGTTSEFLIKHLMNKIPKSLKICALLNKKSARGLDITIDYTGFDVSDIFLIGYGLDYKEKYRNLPYIAAMEKQAG